MMGSSAHFDPFQNSIFISWENSMPSLFTREAILSQELFLMTHIPDWESLTLVKKRIFIAMVSAEFPILFMALIAPGCMPANLLVVMKSRFSFSIFSRKAGISPAGY